MKLEKAVQLLLYVGLFFILMGALIPKILLLTQLGIGLLAFSLASGFFISGFNSWERMSLLFRLIYVAVVAVFSVLAYFAIRMYIQ
ncbi:hypothetical protein SAMN00790413_01923 [Deinococcus hopiensis KR-140]|uniref:Uncharacterized protein n=1 Tax=Deinococcus hopiensis KR-140 TaxID=695939 RepID=A0A1W1VJ96_9DEIO|nr:hypothetical protein SAMN00790413_01923 [Deinococcus hopiensis KR-140]